MNIDVSNAHCGPWISNPGPRLAEGRLSEITGPAAVSWGCGGPEAEGTRAFSSRLLDDAL